MMSIYLLDLLSCPCPSVPPPNNYYTIVPSIYVQLGDAADVLYDGFMLVQMNWCTGDSVTIHRPFVMLSLSVLYVGCHPMFKR